MHDFSKYPYWQSHKIVQAAPIAEIKDSGEANIADRVRTLTLDLGEAGLDTWSAGVNADIWTRYKPKVGDYLVIYAPDNYASISPKKAFDEGYTLSEQGARVEVSAADLRIMFSRALPDDAMAKLLADVQTALLDINRKCHETGPGRVSPQQQDYADRLSQPVPILVDPPEFYFGGLPIEGYAEHIVLPVAGVRYKLTFEMAGNLIGMLQAAIKTSG